MFPFGLLTAIPRDLTLTNWGTSDFSVAPFPASVSGGCRSNGNRQPNLADQWITDEYAASGGFNPALYECGYFNVTGSGVSVLTGPALDQYHPLSSDVTWGLSRSNVGGYQTVGTVKVREIAAPSNEVSATMTLTVTVDADTGNQ